MVIAGLLLFDTTLVIASRLLAGVSILTRGTDHTSHRLVRLGVAVPVVGVALGVVTAVLCALGVMIGRGVLPAPAALVPFLAAAVALPAFLCVQADGHRDRELHRASPTS